MAEENNHDIGLVGIHTVGNFGGAITYYALYKTLKRMGYSVFMIERPANASHKPAISKIYNKIPFPPYDVAKIYPNKQAMKELNSVCEIFIVGSDQLFNDTLYNDFGKWCTLDWVYDNKKKIAYGASFGHDYIWSSEETRSEMQYFMEKFDAFSVREKSGVALCEKEFNIKAEWVLDPVFLCDIQDYNELAQNSQKQFKDNYIGAYILDPDKEKSEIISVVAEDMKLDTEIYTEMHYTEKNMNGFSLEVNFGGMIEDRLSNIMNSDFFIADSFHGICFAIIMRKNFIAIINEKRGKSRFESVLGMLGLENRMISDIDDLKENKEELYKPVDYEKVYDILNKKREFCIQWLTSAIENPKKKSVSSYDILTKRIDMISAKVERLLQENSVLKRKVEHLTEYAGFSLCRINKFIPYLQALEANKENYIICIAVKDTPGFNFSQKMAEEMKELGFNESLVQKHWYGYSAVLDSGKLLGEKLEYQKRVEVKGIVDDISIKAVSRPLKVGNICSILFNGIESAVNKRGINIVVYDKKKKCICDSVAFDTHIATLNCMR